MVNAKKDRTVLAAESLKQVLPQAANEKRCNLKQRICSPISLAVWGQIRSPPRQQRHRDRCHHGILRPPASGGGTHCAPEEMRPSRPSGYGVDHPVDMTWIWRLVWWGPVKERRVRWVAATVFPPMRIWNGIMGKREGIKKNSWK